MLALYENIKKRRLELGISQQELAEAVGYKGKSMISQIEKGSVDLSSSMINKIADALNCTASYLMGWEDSEEINRISKELIEVYTARDLHELEIAMEYYKRFQQLSPEKQAALRILLELPENDV